MKIENLAPISALSVDLPVQQLADRYPASANELMWREQFIFGVLEDRVSILAGHRLLTLSAPILVT